MAKVKRGVRVGIRACGEAHGTIIEVREWKHKIKKRYHSYEIHSPIFVFHVTTTTTLFFFPFEYSYYLSKAILVISLLSTKTICIYKICLIKEIPNW